MKLVTTAEMRQIEKEADAKGLSYEEMMTRAGVGVANFVHSNYREGSKFVLGLVGPGNNGGDTLVALEHLAKLGWQARAYMTHSRPVGDPRLDAAQKAGVEILSASQDDGHVGLEIWLKQGGVLLDGVFGTGVRLPLHGDQAVLLGFVKEKCVNWHVVAIDCPSGVDCDTGEADTACIPAERTICMEAIKVGLLQFPAFGLVGSLETVPLGLPEGLAAYQAVRCEVITSEWVRAHLPARPMDGHKGTFGTAMIVAGCVNYTGAALLAGRAAARIGSGLVCLAVPAVVHAVLAGHFAEATWLLLPEEMGVISSDAADVLLPALKHVSAMLIGPGLGLEDTTGKFLARLLNGQTENNHQGMGFVLPNPQFNSQNVLPALVIDADGLKLLARIPDWWKRLSEMTVLTPHPGEMSVLTGLAIEEIQKKRLQKASEFAQKWQQVVVLKGAATVIAAPDGRIAVIPVATSALAHAGTGDVLAGIITGLRAQGVLAFEAAAVGAWMHARAGQIAEQQVGHPASVLAGDVVNSIAAVLREIN